MLYIPLFDDEILDSGDVAEEQSLGRQNSALGLRGGCPATPTIATCHGILPAPSSCFSLEIQASYETALEKSLAATVLTMEERLSSVRADEPLLKPRGMELAPYRPLGNGMQVMAERSLLCEWSLFHNFALPCRALLLGGRVERSVTLDRAPSRLPNTHIARLSRTSLQSSSLRLPRSPALRRASLTIEGNTTTATPPTHIESPYGGTYEDETITPIEEVLMDDAQCSLDLSSLQDVMGSDEEASVYDRWRQSGRHVKGKRRRGRGSPRGAVVEEVVDVVVQELWAEVVPQFTGLVPPQGIAVPVETQHFPRSSTANSVDTDSTVHPQPSVRSAGKLQRPHTGEPRTTEQRIWVLTPTESPIADQEAAVEVEAAELHESGGGGGVEEQSTLEKELPKERKVSANRKRRVVDVAEPVKTEKRQKKKRSKASGKRRESQKQIMRLDEYVLEQNRLFQQGLSPYAQDAHASIDDSELTLPPLHKQHDAHVYHGDNRSPVPSDDLETTPGAHPTPASPDAMEDSIEGRLPVLSGVILPGAARYDWPARAQTAIPRAMRMHQQYLPSRQ